MNILIIGLGSIARKHLQALRQLGIETNVFALRSSPQAELCEGVTDILSLDALDAEPDFILIANPTHLHQESIESVLYFKKPLFIEKPVLLSADGADELAEKIETAGIMTYVGCHLRFHPCLQYLKDELEQSSEQVNEVNAYCGSYLPDWQPGREWRESFRMDPAKSGGVHLELIHEADYLYWLFGKPRQSRRVLRSVSSLDMKPPDYANYSLEYETFVASVILNYYRRHAKRTLEVIGAESTWVADLIDGSLTKNDSEVFRTEKTVIDIYAEQMRAFLEAVESGEGMGNDVREAVEVLRIAESAS